MHHVSIGATNVGLLDEAVAVETRATAAVRRGWVPLPAEQRRHDLLDQSGWSTRLVGVVDEGALRGFALTLVAEDQPRTGWVFVTVDPAHQGRGIGSRLLRRAAADLDGRVDEVVSRAYRTTAADLDRLVRRFATPHGFEVASSETVLELDVASLPGDLPPPRDDYRVVSYVDGAPEQLHESIGVLMGQVDASAPHGDLNWSATPVTPASYRSQIEDRRRRDTITVETVALGQDEVVAWTCVVAGADERRPAEIEGTIVLPAHRGRGLGLAVKHANLARLRDVGRGRHVRTSSDDENVWMRSINAELGFRPVEVEAVFRRGSA